MIEIHLDLMILFKKTGHLKPADIRQSLNIHQDQIRAVIIQTCPCSLRVQIVIRGFQQKPNFRLEIYPNTIKYFCEITRNLVNSCQIQYRTKAQHKTALFGVIPREGADHVSPRSRRRDCRLHPHQRCNSLPDCVCAPHPRLA